MDAEGQYVDTVFNDNVDRTAEDFVTVSLMMSQPSSERVYSYLGHAGLRLQCPTFNLDYVFAYMSIYRDATLLEYITIQPKMGLFVIPTEQYIEDEFRGVREYPMYLPPQVETELWRILDEEVAKGYDIPFDWTKGSCGQKVYQYVNRAISSVYPKDSVITHWLGETQYTIRELFYQYAPEAPWQRWLMMSYGYSIIDDMQLTNGGKVYYPEQLLALWQRTTLCGKPIISADAKIHTTSKVMIAPVITPVRIAILLTILSILSLATILCRKKDWVRMIGNYLDYIVLGVQILCSLFLIILIWIAYSPIPQTDWNWLLVPFNILPAICWKWRKYWALPYAVVLAVWCLVMVFVPHMLVDTTHIILALAFAIVLLKQSNILQRLIHKSVAQDITKSSNRSLTKKK